MTELAIAVEEIKVVIRYEFEQAWSRVVKVDDETRKRDKKE